MKTKQGKEESDKSVDEEAVSEPKTRARKKASDISDEDKNKSTQDEPKSSKDPKKGINKCKAIVKKRRLGIRKTLRNKKVVVSKEKLKKVIKQGAKRGRKPVVKSEPTSSQDKDEKDSLSLIPATEIKKEPIDEVSPNSRSSSPKTAGRRVRLSSDIMIMKSVLGEFREVTSSIISGPRTSPYSMRKERSNSPSLVEGKNLRSGKPRKVKPNLLNEVVLKEQKKRSRLLSDSKVNDNDGNEDCKKMKRGRSCSRDGSEISKSSDVTESDISLNETFPNDTESKELNKKLEKSKTDLDVDIENSVQKSTIDKVPSLMFDSKSGTKTDTESSSLHDKNKKKPSLKRSTSLDSDNNNGSNHQIIIEHLNSCMDVNEDNSNMLSKTDNDTLLNARNSILTSMSKRFNSKEMSKNIRKARRGRKAAAATRTSLSQPGTDVNTCNSHESIDDKPETLESLSKEIDDLITNLDQSMDHENITETSTATSENTVVESTQPKSATKVSKPLGDNNSIVTNSDLAVKEKESIIVIESSQSSMDDSENIRLHYDSDSGEKSEEQEKQELSYKSNVATIDTLMDRLKVFEELDKRRQRQDSESKPNDKQLMVSNDVVLIPKSGAEIKPLKDIQSVRSPEKPIEKENVLSCFENNSAISIVKRDHVRKSIDVDIPNSLTLIKRNSISRKESTSSNHSRESTDAISFFEKSFGKDVTLTEIRKSVDKSNISSQVDLNQLATLLPTNPTQNIVGIVLDSKQISITPRIAGDSKNALNPAKFSSRDPISRNSSESAAEMEGDKATIEIIKSPLHGIKSPVTAATPIAIKSLEALPIDTDPIAPTIDSVKTLPDTLLMTSGVTNVGEEVVETSLTAAKSESSLQAAIVPLTTAAEVTDASALPEQKAVTDGLKNTEVLPSCQPDIETMSPSESNVVNLPGPSNVIIETPESQVRKESILRTLGLLTHKAAKEAKDLKQKEKERIYGGIQHNKNKSSKSGSADYTGTLKTVIKLNRSSGDKKKYRSSLKMTFQKSKNRSGKPSLEPGDAAAEEDAFYTIERREAGGGATNDGGHRKSYSNRLNNHEAEPASEVAAAEPAKENLVIPEKASSFSIHPRRLCMDQCFYCGGKFGLYDTPCHIAQMKSSERQKKVLSNEEKLTVDSCLCDACYRHVDRRANDPSYRKREAPKHLQIAAAALNTPPSQTEKAPSPTIEEESEEETSAPMTASGRPAVCHTESCAAPAARSIRRKWLIKMRSNVNKVLKLKGDYPGLHTIPLCEEHYRALAPLMACSLCKRSITKHYNVHFINHGLEELNELLGVVGVPVRFSERPLLCKLCRYYCSLLTRPNKHASREIVYRRRLLQIHNIEVPPESEHEDEEMAMEEEASAGSKQKKKNKTKSKQRRSTEQDKSNDGTAPEQQNDQEPMEEDIESLISSNKIPVPGAPKNNVDNIPADMFEPETLLEVDSPVLHLDKQTELQYLLQKQNNPAQFLHKPNTVLTQKQRNKVALDKKKRDWESWMDTGISKPGQLHRINEKNAKRIQKLGQIIIQKEKGDRKELEIEITDKPGDSTKTIMLTDQAILEMSGKKSADINALKNKWQMSESFTQVKKNLSELSKKLTVERVPKKLSDMKYSNPVKRLETNPSISVRELFPGEEEMNLHCNVEFNNVREVTREGWEKCNTTIQYDTETKRLWGELQRPYGSQSSFLRHLVILEKYFRSGELVLAAGASPSAAAYSEATRCRLRAYDNLPPPAAATTATTAPALLDFRRQKTPGKSLLKVNQSETPAASTNTTTATTTTTATAIATAVVMPPPPPKNKQKQDGKTKKALPPELIAINTPNTQGRKKAMQNVLDNIQQLVSGVSASDPTEVAAAPLPAKPDTPKEVKIAPKTEKPKKQKSSSKPWRPTLMPITEENLARIKKEPLQVAVDGRKMPSLVQVKCSDKRYHITLQDYNKMCIIRRGKLQQLQDGDKGSKSESETIVTEIPPSAVLGNGGTVKQSITIDKTLQADKPKAISDLGNAATILKSVGLKNITIAPIPAKCSATTSGAAPASVSGPAGTVALALPKIPKSLTVIPQSTTSTDARP